MIGRSVIKSLRKREAIIQPLFHEDIDLMNYEQTRDLFIDMKPDYCIHLAGFNGNIRFNSLYPADIFHKTSTMGQNVLKSCLEAQPHPDFSVKLRADLESYSRWGAKDKK